MMKVLSTAQKQNPDGFVFFIPGLTLKAHSIALCLLGERKCSGKLASSLWCMRTCMCSCVPALNVWFSISSNKLVLVSMTTCIKRTYEHYARKSVQSLVFLQRFFSP